MLRFSFRKLNLRHQIEVYFVMDNSSKKKLEELRYLMQICSVDHHTREESREIISALRSGVAPEKGVLRFSVGRENLLAIINEDLRHISRGHSRLRFFNGCYGSGKTHMLYILRELSFSSNCASSFITLTPRECPLYDLGLVYSKIVKGLRTNECRHMPALETTIEKWAYELLSMGTHGLEGVMKKIKQLSTDFQNALTSYIEGWKKGFWRNTDLALRWIQGDIRNKHESKVIGASNYASDETAMGMLQNIVLMLKVIGYNGLVILLDEAETIPSVCGLPKIQRAYENLDRLIACNLETSNSYFVYATTPIFFEEARNYYFDKIPEKEVVSLQNLPKSALEDLALNIRNLHIQAYEWPNINRLFRQNILNYVERFLQLYEKGDLARNFVKAMVASLDVCQEDPKVMMSQTLWSYN